MAKKKDNKKHTAHKTNAVRMVEAEGIRYQMHEYDAPEGFLDGVSVAEALGQDLTQVYKTLVTVGASRQNYVCVIPVAAFDCALKVTADTTAMSRPHEIDYTLRFDAATVTPAA